MTAPTTSAGRDGYRTVSAVLFLCLFAGQAGAIALSPVLAQVARDLDVSTAAAGQLRTVAGLVAGVTALGLGRLGARVTLKRQLLGGSLLLALGSLGERRGARHRLARRGPDPHRRRHRDPHDRGHARRRRVGAARTSGGHALVGADRPAGRLDRRYAAARRRRWAQLALRLAHPAADGGSARRRGSRRSRGQTARASTAAISMRATLEAPGLGRWLAAELLTNSAWAGMLVYAGALLVESYQASTALTGAVLALGAGAYVSGNLAFRRLADREPRRTTDPVVRGARPRHRPLRRVPPVPLGEHGTLRRGRLCGRRPHASLERVRTGRSVRSSAEAPWRCAQPRCSSATSRARSPPESRSQPGGYAAFGATIGVLFLSAALVLGRSPSTFPRRLRIALSSARG